ncbi:uncharacterized protein LOC126799118 [Argentina anserina]|uniref:uncharacterized protein LOC126799118 n=1 Tax=Argentina anserina TaxID=57926 RepID=UPI0021768A02|nr:uncharacterized protein LOC126799118 [Potentilla anserina]XP_050382199.1 uncharacterized protein LOC126799118 [Potentilla anserina]
MGVTIIPDRVRNVWEKWNLRSFVLLSLSLQTILILFAPFRKRTPNTWLTTVIWSAYLLADWAANFSVGLISNSQGDSSVSDEASDLLVFWAPFLLLHLGGPDTITAFALEDNTLWLRHLLGLVFQVIASVYIFLQSLPNKLWLPTSLLFVAGIIKYAERTRALYLASLDNFKESMLKKPDAGPNYAKLMEEYSSKLEAQLPTHIELTAERSKESRTLSYVIEKGDLENDIAVVRHAHHFFQIFKGLIVDLIFSFHERYESRVIFHERTSEEAFKLIAVELNFIYEALFTKVVVVHSKLGYFFRAISLGAVSAALVFFYKLEKEGLQRYDVRITYGLLFGAIGLDTLSAFMVLFSDWTVAALNKSWQDSCIAAAILGKYLHLKRSRWYTSTKNDSYQAPISKPTKCLEWTRELLFRRWYESVSAFNLIQYSLEEYPKLSPGILDYFGIVYIKIIDLLGLKDLRDRMKYRSSKPLKKDLWDFIFKVVKSKSLLADDPETAKKICSARGEWVLQDSDWTLRDSYWDSTVDKNMVISKLLSYVVDVDYDQSILLWHIATEFCYNMEDYKEASDDNGGGNAGEPVSTSGRINSFFSKLSRPLRIGLDFVKRLKGAIRGLGEAMVNYCRQLVSCRNAGDHLKPDECVGAAADDDDSDDSIHYFGNRKEYSKTLSDYMLYLLVMQPTLMSSVPGIGQIRFRDTCEEAKKFFSRRDLRSEVKEACKRLLDVNTDVKPINVKGDRSKSVLFDACILAKELQVLKENKWDLISEVWVELLSFAAGHCRANDHAQLLCKGGELVTFIWLLMAHFGIGEQFQINEGHARAKLVVGK